MTQPRRIVPGDTWMITRRITQRMFLLRPDSDINAMFEYCLAEAAARHRVVVIGWLAMSNHYHAIVNDPEGRLPAFLEHFHRNVAKVLNVRHKRWENVWSTDATCATLLVTPEDVLDKLVYVLTNPVAAGLVDTTAHWPGTSSWAFMRADGVRRKRPSLYFKKSGSAMPQTAELRASPPVCFSGAAAEWTRRVRDAVAKREAELRDRRHRSGTKLIGRKAVLATSPFETAHSDTRRRTLRPALACSDRARMAETRVTLRGFRARYRAVLKAFRAGKMGPEMRFPVGTYRMRLLGVGCESFCKQASS